MNIQDRIKELEERIDIMIKVEKDPHENWDAFDIYTKESLNLLWGKNSRECYLEVIKAELRGLKEGMELTAKDIFDEILSLKEQAIKEDYYDGLSNDTFKILKQGFKHKYGIKYEY